MTYNKKEYQARWRAENKDKIHASYKRHALKWPEKKMLKCSRVNAKVRGLEHSIELSDIILPEVCPYLKVPIDTHNCSLDRIDSSKGYIKGNVQVISKLANLMKSNATEEQLVQFARSVLETHNV